MIVRSKKIVCVFFVPILTTLFLLFPKYDIQGATLSSTYIMLSRIQANLISTADLEIYIAFETSSTIPTGSTLTLEFPDGDDTTWCRTAGSDLTVVGVNATPADSTGVYDIDNVLPGTLSASCTQGGGASSVDTITITGVTELTLGTTYGVKVSNGTTAKLGTSSAGQKIFTITVQQGTTIETKSFGINLVSNDTVTVSAEVLDPPTVTCSLSTNSIDLGNLYRGGSYVTGTHTLSASTSDNASGYYWAVYGQGDGSTNAGLYKSTPTTYLIESDDNSSTVDISVPGSEGFGLNVDIPTGDAVAGTGFGDNSEGVFGSLGMGVSNAKLLLYRNWGPQITSSTSIITYGARAGSSAVAGTYSETVTFVCGGYYGGNETEPEMTLLSLPSTSSSEGDSGGSAIWTDPSNAQLEDGDMTYSLVATGGTCLSPDTLVWTEDGDKPIQDLNIGDRVYSYNFDSEKLEINTVGNIWNTPIVNADSKYYEIYYEDSVIRATYNHQFYSGDEYVLAKDLAVGDRLLDSSGNLREIKKVEIVENNTDQVWDLSINGNHNFFANGVLVHNQGVYDHNVKLIKEGSVVGTNKASPNAWQSNLTYSIYGGPGDLWGEAWTASDINSTDFGIALSTYASGYTSNNTSEHLKVNNFGLNVPSNAIIEGIEVKVRKRLRGDSNIYSDIDSVKVKIYYSLPSWTLDINNVSSPTSYTNVVTIPEDIDIYLDWIPNDSYNVDITYILGNSGDNVDYLFSCTPSYSWITSTTENFTSGDGFSIKVRCLDLPVANRNDFLLAISKKDTMVERILKVNKKLSQQTLAARPVGGGLPSPDPCSGQIILRENDENGRAISDFTYYDDGTSNTSPICPA